MGNSGIMNEFSSDKIHTTPKILQEFARNMES